MPSPTRTRPHDRARPAFGENDLDRVLAAASDDIEVVLVPFGQTLRGREGFRAFLQGFRGAFPDLRLTVTNQVAADDQAVSEFTAQGTHTGPLQTPAGEIAPTGRPVDFTGCEVWRVRTGRITRLVNYQDSANLLRQLGQLP